MSPQPRPGGHGLHGPGAASTTQPPSLTTLNTGLCGVGGGFSSIFPYIEIVILRFDVNSDEAEVIIQLSQIDNKSTVLARFDIYISFHYFDSN